MKVSPTIARNLVNGRTAALPFGTPIVVADWIPFSSGFSDGEPQSSPAEVDENVAAMPPAPGLDVQAGPDASGAAADMNVPRSSEASPARAMHPRFQEPMPEGPNTITVENHCDTWLGLGILCRKIGGEFQYGSVRGVPAGGNITLTVPNETFYVYWIRQDRPTSRFQLPDPVTLSGGNDRIQKYVTLAIGSNTGENAIEEEF